MTSYKGEVKVTSIQKSNEKDRLVMEAVSMVMVVVEWNPRKGGLTKTISVADWKLRRTSSERNRRLKWRRLPTESSLPRSRMKLRLTTLSRSLKTSRR